LQCLGLGELRLGLGSPPRLMQCVRVRSAIAHALKRIPGAVGVRDAFVALADCRTNVTESQFQFTQIARANRGPDPITLLDRNIEGCSHRLQCLGQPPNARKR